MGSLPVWSTSWTDDKARQSALGFLWALLIPGVPLLIWIISEPSVAWVMNISEMVGVFLYLPYALLVVLLLGLRLLIGGDTHTTSLRVDCGTEPTSVYRETSEWSVEVSVDKEVLRSLTFSPEHFEGFAREPLPLVDEFSRWFRIVLLLKATEPIVLVDKLPDGVSCEALAWLCEKTNTKPAPGSEPM